MVDIDTSDEWDEYLEDLEEETERKADKRGRRIGEGITSLPKMKVDGASVKLHVRLADERFRRIAKGE